jgi:hypothetical protein
LLVLSLFTSNFWEMWEILDFAYVSRWLMVFLSRSSFHSYSFYWKNVVEWNFVSVSCCFFFRWLSSNSVNPRRCVCERINIFFVKEIWEWLGWAFVTWFNINIRIGWWKHNQKLLICFVETTENSLCFRRSLSISHKLYSSVLFIHHIFFVFVAFTNIKLNFPKN